MYCPVVCVPAQSLTFRLPFRIVVRIGVRYRRHGCPSSLLPHSTICILGGARQCWAADVCLARMQQCARPVAPGLSSVIMKAGLREGRASSRAMLLAAVPRTPASLAMCIAAPAALTPQVLCLQCVSAQGRQLPDHGACIHQHEQLLTFAACTAFKCCWLQL